MDRRTFLKLAGMAVAGIGCGVPAVSMKRVWDGTVGGREYIREFWAGGKLLLNQCVIGHKGLSPPGIVFPILVKGKIKHSEFLAKEYVVTDKLLVVKYKTDQTEDVPLWTT